MSSVGHGWLARIATTFEPRDATGGRHPAATGRPVRGVTPTCPSRGCSSDEHGCARTASQERRRLITTVCPRARVSPARAELGTRGKFGGCRSCGASTVRVIAIRTTVHSAHEHLDPDELVRRRREDALVLLPDTLSPVDGQIVAGFRQGAQTSRVRAKQGASRSRWSGPRARGPGTTPSTRRTGFGLVLERRVPCPAPRRGAASRRSDAA